MKNTIITTICVLLGLGVVFGTAYALTIAEREDAFRQRLTALQTRKAVFKQQVGVVLEQVATPMIAEVNAMIIESQAIQDDAQKLMDDANIPEAKQAVITKIVDNACDPNSLQQKKATLDLLIWIIDLAKEDLTR